MLVLSGLMVGRTLYTDQSRFFSPTMSMKIVAGRNGKDLPQQRVVAPASRFWLLAALGVIAALSGIAIYWWWDSTPDRRDEALRLAQQGHVAEAEPLLIAALERNANDVEVVAALARIKLGGSDQVAGEKYLSRWCELRPSEARPFQLRMDLRHRTARGLWSTADRLRMMETALADGRRVLELDPTNDPVRREVASLALQVGRYPEAEAECRRSLASAPVDGWMNYLLAKICHAQGKRKEAETALDPVVRAQPGFADVYLLRATLFYEADQPDRAVPLLRQALALKDCPRRECLYRLGLALAATGQAEEARKTLAEVDLLNLTTAVTTEEFPNNPAMRVQIAEAMIGVGRLTDARAELEAILAQDPQFAPAHRVKAVYHDRMGQPDQAAEHRRRAGDSP
jgi:tetratricopeptide (TPR) repeat protein